MPPTRTEPAPAPEEASAAAPAATPAPPTAGGGGFKPWLPLVATVLVMPVPSTLIVKILNRFPWTHLSWPPDDQANRMVFPS